MSRIKVVDRIKFYETRKEWAKVISRQLSDEREIVMRLLFEEGSWMVTIQVNFTTQMILHFGQKK